MRRLLILALCLLALTDTPAWAAAHGQSPVDRADAALTEARTVLVTRPEDGLKLVQGAETQLTALPPSQARTIALAKARWLRGEAALRAGDTRGAHRSIDAAMRMIAGIHSLIPLRGDLLRVKGVLQMQAGDPAAALASYLNAFDIFRRLGDARSQSVVLQYIASLYSSANDLQRAEKYLRQARDAYSGDPAMALSIENNLGTVLVKLERYGDAESEFRRALGFAEKLGTPLLRTRVIANLALTEVEAGQLDAAERTLATGFRLAADPAAQPLLPPLNAIAARIAFSRGDAARAEALIGRAFAGVDLHKTTGDFRDAHLFAYQIYASRGDTRRALAHLEALRRITEESTKVATTTGAALMAARFDYANQEAKIANLRAEEADRRARAQQILFFSIGGAALIILVLLSIGIVTLRRSRNQVRAANADLAQTNVALEKALKAKTEFLATTSHEIRTPLNGILGMTQVMLADPSLPAATRDRIGVVHGAGVTMRSLVDDILDVAKIETGNLTVEAAPMDLCGTLKEVTRMWDEHARAKGLRFALDLGEAPAWIVSDAGRLRQIVFNLLSNAIKFTDTGEVGLRGFVSGEGDARRLRLAVRDSGIGIPADKCETIFESFKQADSSTTRKYGGTGLGLTICRNLARALGGDILVESAEGKGSTFTIDLPLTLADAPATPALPAERGSLLVLDRNPIARSMLRTLFEARGIRVAFASSPDEVIRALEEKPFDRILADEATVKASGGDDDSESTVTAIAAAARAHRAGLVLLWTKIDESLRTRLVAAGSDQLIEKPISGTALIESLFPVGKENSPAADTPRLVSGAA